VEGTQMARNSIHVMGFCGHDNEPLCSVRGGGLPDELSDYHFMGNIQHHRYTYIYIYTHTRILSHTCACVRVLIYLRMPRRAACVGLRLQVSSDVSS
jgi:hypothetical protein